MTSEEQQTKLYEKVSAEQDRYRNWLLCQSPEEVLSHACEYTIREDIVMVVETAELSEAHVTALLKSPFPLMDIYKEWEKPETHHMDDVRSAIEARADSIIENEKKPKQREER